jgi:hypothetical protein
VGRGTRTIKIYILNGRNGPCTEDLVLTNVALVPGFHVNVVSEARLRESGLWGSGFDGTLGWGTMEASTVMARLQCRFNLTFLQFMKVISPYKRIPKDQFPCCLL